MTAFSPGAITIGGSLSYAEHITPAGTFIQHIHLTDDLGRDMVVNGMTFDSVGNMYAALGVPGGSDYEPHDIVWMPDNSGLLVIIVVGGDVQLWKYAMNGTTVLDTWTGLDKDTGWDGTQLAQRLKVDIACDSTTVYYTDGGLSLFKYDLNTSAQLTPWDVLSSSPYRYHAFKLLQRTLPQEIISAMTESGNGPQRALCLDADGDKHWTDEINPSGDYHVYRRANSDGSALSNHVVSLDPADTNDLIWSLACYYNPCLGRRKPFGVVIS